MIKLIVLEWNRNGTEKKNFFLLKVGARAFLKHPGWGGWKTYPEKGPKWPNHPPTPWALGPGQKLKLTANQHCEGPILPIKPKGPR
jgi:hypothetical protein